MTPRKSEAEKWRETVREHFDGFWGKPRIIYTPKDKKLPRVSVAEYPPSKGRPHWVYATIGMASKEQFIPKNSPDWLCPRVEIFSYLSIQSHWPVEVLNLLGRLPRRKKSWLFWWHTVDCKGPLDEKEDTTTSAGLLLPPYLEPEGFDELYLDEKRIRLLFFLPISEEERKFASARGGQTLEERLVSAEIDFVFDPLRPSIV